MTVLRSLELLSTAAWLLMSRPACNAMDLPAPTCAAVRVRSLPAAITTLPAPCTVVPRWVVSLLRWKLRSLAVVSVLCESDVYSGYRRLIEIMELITMQKFRSRNFGHVFIGSQYHF